MRLLLSGLICTVLLQFILLTFVSSDKEKLSSSKKVSRESTSSTPSLVGSHGQFYDANADILWRYGHDHKMPNTPSFYVQFFELKYILSVLKRLSTAPGSSNSNATSVQRHLWLDTSPIHAQHSSTHNHHANHNNDHDDHNKKQDNNHNNYPMVLVPAYAICDLLPSSLHTHVTCLTQTHQLAPPCAAKKTFSSQLPLLSASQTKDRQRGKIATSSSVCFHSPIITNRHQLNRQQRFALFADDPTIRLRFSTYYEQLFAALQTALFSTGIAAMDTTPAHAMTPSSSSSPSSPDATLYNSETSDASTKASTSASNTTFLPRLQRIAESLLDPRYQSRNQMVVFHWYCSVYNDMATTSHDTTNDNNNNNNNNNNKNKNSKDSNMNTHKNSETKASTSKNNQNGHGKDNKNGKNKKDNSLQLCAKEFDAVLKVIDRERRHWDRVHSQLLAMQNSRANTHGNNSNQHDVVRRVKENLSVEVVLVVTPPQDESFTLVRYAADHPPDNTATKTSSKKSVQTTKTSSSHNQLFFQMLHRRLTVFNTAANSSSSSSRSSSSDAHNKEKSIMGPIRLARDVITEYLSQLKQQKPPANLLPMTSTTTKGVVNDQHSASKSSDKYSDKNNMATTENDDEPSMKDIHILEAQLMVDAQVFYGLGLGVSLLQDAVESERYLRYQEEEEKEEKHKHDAKSSSSVVDSSSRDPPPPPPPQKKKKKNHTAGNDNDHETVENESNDNDNDNDTIGAKNTNTNNSSNGLNKYNTNPRFCMLASGQWIERSSWCYALLSSSAATEAAVNYNYKNKHDSTPQPLLKSLKV